MEKNQGAIFCGVKRSFSPPTLLMALRLLCFMFTLCFCDIVIPSPHPFEGRWPLTVFRSFGWQLFNTTLPMVTLSTVSSEKQTNFFFFFLLFEQTRSQYAQSIQLCEGRLVLLDIAVLLFCFLLNPFNRARFPCSSLFLLFLLTGNLTGVRGKMVGFASPPVTTANPNLGVVWQSGVKGCSNELMISNCERAGCAGFVRFYNRDVSNIVLPQFWWSCLNCSILSPQRNLIDFPVMQVPIGTLVNPLITVTTFSIGRTGSNCLSCAEICPQVQCPYTSSDVLPGCFVFLFCFVLFCFFFQ